MLNIPKSLKDSLCPRAGLWTVCFCFVPNFSHKQSNTFSEHRIQSRTPVKSGVKLCNFDTRTRTHALSNGFLCSETFYMWMCGEDRMEGGNPADVDARYSRLRVLCWEEMWQTRGGFQPGGPAMLSNIAQTHLSPALNRFLSSHTPPYAHLHTPACKRATKHLL